MSSHVFVALVLLLAVGALGTLQATESAVLYNFQDVHRRHKKLSSFLQWRTASTMNSAKQFRSVTANGDNCDWDEETRDCHPSEEALAETLQGADTAYGQLISHFLACDAAADEVTCQAAGNCFWAKKQGFCTFVTLSKGHEDSPCVKDAPKSVEYFKDSQLCPLLDAQACFEEPHCSWNSEEEFCSLEISKLYLGFSGEEMGTALRSVLLELRTIFPSEFDLSDPKFEAESVLDWKTPKAECQEGTPQAACDFAQLLASYFVPVSYYCQTKYRDIFSFAACRADPLCRFDIGSFTCLQSEKQLQVALGKAYEDSQCVVEQPVDKEFLDKFGYCLQQATEDTCGGDCIWYGAAVEAVCSLRSDVFFSMVSKPGKGGTDAPCYFFKTLADSNCFDQLDADSCMQKEGCQWEMGGCSVRFGYLLASVFDMDAVAMESYTELALDCLTHTSSDTCVAADAPGIVVPRKAVAAADFGF